MCHVQRYISEKNEQQRNFSFIWEISQVEIWSVRQYKSNQSKEWIN
jgi:hypothetical protein